MQRRPRGSRSEWGRIDHVVFAAAIGSGKFGFPFWTLEPADWDRVLQVNVVGAANVAHAFAPALVEARSGTMLFLASIAGQIGSQTDPPYSASKAAVINFMQCCGQGPRALSACASMPSVRAWCKTDLNRSVWAGLARPAAAGGPASPTRNGPATRSAGWCRWAAGRTPEDVAAMAVFLASARAKNVTGQTINVDGGFVMHW